MVTDCSNNEADNRCDHDDREAACISKRLSKLSGKAR